ncbi:MAG: DNA repair protein RecO [Flavobacteriales bacterium]|nr:DNA repair protein RecO [Flavobacteriales bacterium]
MLLSSKGIVLQSFKYGESSLISKVFSEEKGLITLISNRSKNKKNRQANFFQPLSAICFVCYLSNKSDIHRIKELSYNQQIPQYSENVALSAIRFFLAEFLSKVIKEEEQNIILFSFLETKLSELNSIDEITGHFHIKVLIELLEILGIQPLLKEGDKYFDFEEGSSSNSKPLHPNFCDKTDLDLLLYAQKDYSLLNKNNKASLLNILIDFYNIQLGGGFENLKSKSVLEIVFN